MGWPKYYEDNVSICIGRMAVKEYIPVKPTPVRAHRIDRRVLKELRYVLRLSIKELRLKLPMMIQ